MRCLYRKKVVKFDDGLEANGNANKTHCFVLASNNWVTWNHVSFGVFFF